MTVAANSRKQAKVWAQPRTPTLKKNKDLSNEDQQENVTKRLKLRLGHTSSNSSVDQQNLDGTTAEPIEKITLDFPLSRERIESLTVIDKDELNKYLTEDLTQEEESNPAEDEEEMLRIFEKRGAQPGSSASGNNGIPYLDNYVLCSKNGQDGQPKPKHIDGNQLSELRNMIAQNIPSARPEVPRPASSALAMIAHQNQIAQNPARSKGHNANTFVPISRSALGNAQSVGASPFVSPRSTPILRPRRPNLPPLQMQPQHYVKQEPISAPNSPSMSQPFRYFPHAMNAAPPMYQQDPMNRSASVPIPNYPAAPPGYIECTSNYTSVNPTPVPSECNDFSDPNNLLEMFAENGNMPTVKSEFFLDDDDVSSSIGVNDVLDETNAKIPNTSLVSRSVPSTPLPTYTKGAKYAVSCSAFDMSKSVPTTPVNGQSDTFRYTPPASRDYLINGYTHEPDKNQDDYGPSYLAPNSERYPNSDENLIETNIFD